MHRDFKDHFLQITILCEDVVRSEMVRKPSCEDVVFPCISFIRSSFFFRMTFRLRSERVSGCLLQWLEGPDSHGPFRTGVLRGPRAAKRRRSMETVFFFGLISVNPIFDLLE